jgi:hypothetical protein
MSDRDPEIRKAGEWMSQVMIMVMTVTDELRWWRQECGKCKAT